MTGFSDEAEPIGSAPLSAASGVSALRNTNGGFSVGGILNARNAGAGPSGGDSGAEMSWRETARQDGLTPENVGGDGAAR
jgi:hypothetical protein